MRSLIVSIIAMIVLIKVDGSLRSTRLVLQMYLETSTKEEVVQLICQITGSCNNSRVVRSEPEVKYPRAVMRAAIQDLMQNRARRQLRPDTLTSDLGPWADDLKALIEMLEEIRTNPQYSDIVPSHIDTAVSTAKSKLREVAQYLSYYKHALFASVVHPADDLEVVELDKVIGMINKVNEAGYRVPLFRGAAHAVSGLYMGNVQNMVIINNHKNLKLELQSKVAGSRSFSPGDEQRYKRLEIQIANAKAKLATALDDVGLPYSQDMGDLDELSFLTNRTVEVILEAKKLAENALSLSNTIGKQNTATYLELQRLSASLKQPERSGLDYETESYLDMEASDEAEEESAADQGYQIGGNGCLVGVNVVNEDGTVKRIGNETVVKRFGLLHATDTYVYDFRGNCTTLRVHHSTLSRQTRRVSDNGRNGVTRLISLTNQVIRTANDWIIRRKRTRIVKRANMRHGCKKMKAMLKACRSKGST